MNDNFYDFLSKKPLVFNLYFPDIGKSLPLSYQCLQHFGKLHLCKQNCNIYLFSLPDPSRIRKHLVSILIFMAIYICINSLRVCSPISDIIRDIGFITIVLMAFTEMSILRICIDLVMTKQLWRTKVNFKDPACSLKKTSWYLVTEFPVHYQVNKEGHFLACSWTSKYLGPQEERNLPKFIGITGKSGGKYLVCLLLALRDLVEVQTEIPYEKFQQNNLKELMWSIIYVNNQSLLELILQAN